MAEPEYLMVRNWDKFQGYKAHSPIWIKLYVALADDPRWDAMDEVGRAHLIGVFLLAARTGNRILNNPAWVERRIQATQPVDLKKLTVDNWLVPYTEDNPVSVDTTTPSTFVDDPLRSSTNGDTDRERDREENKKEIENEKKQNLKFSLYESGDSNLMVSPPRSIATALGTLAERVAVKEAEEGEDVAQTLNGFFPPKRVGAGANPSVVRWVGRIPESQIAHALNYYRAQTYRVDGEERTWGQLTEDHCQRVLTAGLNAILRERSG